MPYDPASVVALVLAAGSGERLGAGVPKAFHGLGSSSILEHAVSSVASHPGIGSVLVVAPTDYCDKAAQLTHQRATVVAGGLTRQDSVRRGLAAVPDVTDVVLVHDAARPFVPVAVIDRVLDALVAGADAAVPALPVVDTIKRVDADGRLIGTLDRDQLRAVQTPQGFRFAALVSAHRYARTAGLIDVSDDAGLVERHGGRVVLVDGSTEAFKITRPLDLAVAEYLLAQREQRS